MTEQANASQRGPGVYLVKEGQPIAFASKSFTDTEAMYDTTKGNFLALNICTESHLQ